MKINENCYVQNSEADNQSRELTFGEDIWTGPHIVVKVLSNNNYTILRLGIPTQTRYTQTLHRIRLPTYHPEQRQPDATVKQTDFIPDPKVLVVQHNERSAKAWDSNPEDQNANELPTEQTESNTAHNEETRQTEIDEIIDNENTSTTDFSQLTTDVGVNPFITNLHL